MTTIVPPPTRNVVFTRVEICPEARAAAERVLASGWVTTGPEVLAFEEEFAAEVGARHAVAVSSCTAAIEIALRTFDLAPGDRVLTSAMTFCGVAHAIRRAGGEPVLVDIDPVTLMPSAETTAAAARRVGGVSAMVVLHFAGNPAPVAELAEAAGLPLSRVIEDAAHGPGLAVGDRPVGSISAATCFSFYATKNLPLGEGGMLTTDDGAVAEAARSLRLHGMSRDAWRRYEPGSSWRYAVDHHGLKANMTDVQAAIGRAQLCRFPGWQERRHELAERYHRGLAGIPGIITPRAPDHGRHAWHLYVIRLTPELGVGRDELIAALADQGVHCSVHFIPLHHHGFWAAERPVEADVATHLPLVEAVFPTIVSLPFYPALSDDDADHVCESIARIAARSSVAEPLAVTPSRRS